jgi:hypothetical protein
MSQNDFSIANQGFPSFRSDLNSALQALASNSAGATEPSTTYAYQWWYDSTTDILKIRNAGDDAWISFASFDQATDAWSFANVTVDGTLTAADLVIDTDTLTVDTGNNRVGIGTATPAATLEVDGNAIAKTDTDTTNTGSVTLDFGANQNFVLTLTGNVTLANPTTEQVGQSGFIVFIQDGTGGRTVSLGTDYETAGGAGLTLSSAASATDIVPYVVAASGRILLGAPQLAFA